MTMRTKEPAMSPHDLYRELPSVSDLLLKEPVRQLLQSHAHDRVVGACRVALEEIREAIALEVPRDQIADRIATLPQAIEAQLNAAPAYSLRPAINATGVVLHTNLGRAPLSQKALDHVLEVARGYSNLEYDLTRGERGKRDVHVEAPLLALLRQATGIESIGETHRAIVVNNCAAATFLALHALAKGKEVLVSRGELVEIGGGFRIPEILQESGAVLKEVGTTNRTRIADYERAASANTGLVLRVHQSNFSMDGFVERPPLDEVVSLGRRLSIPVFEDQGTGLLQSLQAYGISGEPTLAGSVGAGCDLVAASGDKLFGGPQCGMLIGKREIIDQIRKDPLFRTYRVDKLSYAALEGTLQHYLADAWNEIPILRMIQRSAHDIAARCEQVAAAIRNRTLFVEVAEVESVLGGGTAPTARVRSYAVSLKHAGLTAEECLSALRRLDPPVIGRIADDRVLLDLRTVEPEHDEHLIQALNALPLSPAPIERERS